MIPEPFYEMRDDYLFIKPSGERKSLTEVIKSSENITRLSTAYNTDRILADYTDVYFRLPMTDAFNLVRLYENRITDFQKVSLAVVINKETYEIGKFWERICHKRGFNNAVFLSISEAREWLLTKGTSSKL